MNENYSPSNTVISIAGNFDEEEFISRIEENSRIGSIRQLKMYISNPIIKGR